MQLAITGTGPLEVKIKSVEIFDDTGKSLGMITALSPTRWSAATSAYEPWDEKVTTDSSTNASYVLAQPPIDPYGDRSKQYRVKVVVSIGGVDQTVTKSAVALTAMPPSVPT